MKCAVLGRPIAHSLSPALHRAAYEVLGLTDWSYDRFDVGVEELHDFVAGCGPGWRGLSLTMPLKAAALTLGEPDPVAVEVGAANTVIFEGDRRRVYNTDVEGLVWALRRSGLHTAPRAVIVGAGATARSAVASLRDLRARELVVVARDRGRAAPVLELAHAFGLAATVQAWDDPVPASDVVVSTVTAGAVDHDRAAELARSAPVVFDALYQPWPTPLAEAADSIEHAVVNGLDLLVGQALGQLRLMTGREVDPEVLYNAGRAGLP